MKRSLLGHTLTKGQRIISLILIIFSVMKVSAYKKESIDITVNGQKRNMVVFTPNSFPAKSPLFIVTHGMNQDPEYQYGSDKMYEMIDTAKFVITYLRSDGNTWDTGGTMDQNFVIKAIDEMANRFDIDTDRVYWSGFSMGSMLIHHCISKMQDKIAAFAPTSGIQFSEQPWNNCKKPVNLLECIAYDDDVFGYEQYGIHAYIENYAKHDKHTRYSKTAKYKPISSSWYDGDLEKWTGSEKGGEVWLYSYHNGGHYPMDLNRHLIWNFCKRFSLGQPLARITEPAGETLQLCLAPKGEESFHDITVEATATPTNGTIVKMEFYDGAKLLGSQTEAPYQATLTAPAAGKHELRAVVTDDLGKTGESSCMVNCTATASAFSLYSTFKCEGAVPQNWHVSNGSVERVGGGLPYTSGPRILRFTNTTKDFEYGLLVQNSVGETTAWAKFGDRTSHSYLSLHAGHYAVKYKVCNWKKPAFTPVTIAIERLDGQTVASQTYTPTVNIGASTSKKFSGTVQQTFEFDIPETGDYVVAFHTDTAKNADFVLGLVTLHALSFVPTAISRVNADKPVTSSKVYDLSGRQLSKDNLKPGLYIIDGRKVVNSTK